MPRRALQQEPQEQKQEWEPWRQELPEQREPQAWERRERQAAKAPARAWWGSCAERWEAQDAQGQQGRPEQRGLQEPAAPWRLRGEESGAPGRREQRDAAEWEPWAQQDAEPWGEREQRDAAERGPREEPGAEESEEEEEYS